ncbi:unnamed protein product, partial [Iphiclides podalirius]
MKACRTPCDRCSSVQSVEVSVAVSFPVPRRPRPAARAPPPLVQITCRALEQAPRLGNPGYQETRPLASFNPLQ